jgi:hypothetical protein
MEKPSISFRMKYSSPVKIFCPSKLARFADECAEFV